MKQYLYLYLTLIILGLFSSCKVTKYVPEGGYLLTKSSIVFVKDSIKVQKVNVEQMNSILKQKPNRKILLGFRFHLRMYNLSNQSRIEKKILKNQNKIEKKNEKIKLKNERRLAKNPDYKIKMLESRKLTFGEKLRSAGEEPVILDQNTTEKSAKQLSIHLINKGYFNNVVTDSIVLNEDKKLAEVFFKVKTGKPYTYRKIKYLINDTLLTSFIDSLSIESLLKTGDNFDTDILDDERHRLTNYLMNNGYHYFNRDFIYYKADTSLSDYQVDLVMGVQNYKYKSTFSDTVLERSHKRYKISEVNFQLLKGFNQNPLDTVLINYKDIKISYHSKLICKPELLYKLLTFKKGDYYNKLNVESTYKKLANLGLFEEVAIKFDTSSVGNGLAVFISLVEAKSQTFTLSTDGTNNEGLFGIEGSLNYSHRNLFKGAEHLSISLTGGFESQLLLTGSNDSLSALNSILFNTIEFGPKLSFTLPKYLFINKFKFLKDHSSGRTEFTASLNYQERPDFKRSIQELSFGWTIHEKGPFTWHVNPILISAIDITIDSASLFGQQIIDLNDKFIAASFQDHIISGGLFSFEYNGQNDKKIKNVFYVKAVVETGGGLLYRTHQLLNKPFDNPSTNSYNLFGIRYAHFQKFFTDFRYYIPLGERGKLVYRLSGGIGIPRENLKEALPFEKSFFSGGANGMRAWRARSLGPGSFYDSQNRFDKIGDVQLEGNVELRFPLISWVEGALFVDAGNVWLLNDDPLRPGGQFSNDFLNDLAVGGGLGIRMDLDFFIIRLDLGIPLRNPAIQMNDSSLEFNPWIFQSYKNNEKRFFDYQFNLGIGYPF